MKAEKIKTTPTVEFKLHQIVKFSEHIAGIADNMETKKEIKKTELHNMNSVLSKVRYFIDEVDRWIDKEESTQTEE